LNRLWQKYYDGAQGYKKPPTDEMFSWFKNMGKILAREVRNVEIVKKVIHLAKPMKIGCLSCMYIFVLIFVQPQVLKDLMKELKIDSKKDTKTKSIIMNGISTCWEQCNKTMEKVKTMMK